MTQLKLGWTSEIPREAYEYGSRTSGETHGVVLTKAHVVELILDLAGYTSDRDLCAVPLLEPSCGKGAFLRPAIERLLRSARSMHRDPDDLRDAIAAYDIDPMHVADARAVACETLRAGGLPDCRARALAESWVRERDFLMAPETPRFGAVVGNPPYVRIEQIAPVLQAEYRERFVSLYDRADLYVAFIERGLDLLRSDGVLAFVCADRWTLNKYGAPLRRLISKRFKVRAYVDLHQASPFESEVVAYPAIFALSRGSSEHVAVAKLESASERECSDLRAVLADPSISRPGVSVATYQTWFADDAPWTITSPVHLTILRELEKRFQPIEALGRARVGIGVATGNDKVYIVGEDADIEPDRLVPLVMRSDIERGFIHDSRRFVINAFRSNGSVIDLRDYPRLERYLNGHGTAVRARHVSKTNPQAWFRTIDRVYPELASKPKLLIPDIAGSNEVAFECGRFHPHHNLYFLTSEVWDLEVLGALLSSRVALFFVWSYAVKMRGGYLRFQAQYLRRIRVPAPEAVPARLAKSLAAAFRKRDFTAIDKLALKAYALDVLPHFDFVDTRK
jgi:adenine-specific DNA-methyltransferase